MASTKDTPRAQRPVGLSLVNAWLIPQQKKDFPKVRRKETQNSIFIVQTSPRLTNKNWKKTQIWDGKALQNMFWILYSVPWFLMTKWKTFTRNQLFPAKQNKTNMYLRILLKIIDYGTSGPRNTCVCSAGYITHICSITSCQPPSSCDLTSDLPTHSLVDESPVWCCFGFSRPNWEALPHPQAPSSQLSRGWTRFAGNHVFHIGFSEELCMVALGKCCVLRYTDRYEWKTT